MKSLGILFGTALIILVGGALVPSIANMISVINQFIPLIEILPIAIIIFVLPTIFLLFRGGGTDSNSIVFGNALSQWTKQLYENESEPLRQTWNCKNCGGPNIDQIKCQYCGMVKE